VNAHLDRDPDRRVPRHVHQPEVQVREQCEDSFQYDGVSKEETMVPILTLRP